MSSTTDPETQWLTPEQVANMTPVGNADWVRQQLRAGRLRGSKVGGSWWVDPAAVREMVDAASNTAGRSPSSRRRRQRAS